MEDIFKFFNSLKIKGHNKSRLNVVTFGIDAETKKETLLIHIFDNEYLRGENGLIIDQNRFLEVDGDWGTVNLSKKKGLNTLYRVIQAISLVSEIELENKEDYKKIFVDIFNKERHGSARSKVDAFTNRLESQKMQLKQLENLSNGE